MNDLIYILQKLIIFQVSISNGKLKVAKSTQGKGYTATVQHENMNKYVELHIRSISVETNPDVIGAGKNPDNDASLLNETWNELRPLLNSITDTMK